MLDDLFEFVGLFFKVVVVPIVVAVMLVLLVACWPVMVEQASSDRGGWDSGERPAKAL